MSTQKQIAANRRNALRSTGPRTSEGKARSCKNAMSHGLTAAKHIVLDGEDPAEFIALRDDLIEEYAPETVLQMACVNRIADTVWRLRRIPAFESALITLCDLEKRADSFSVIPMLDPQPANAEEARRLKIGQVLKVMLNTGVLEKLARYGATLCSQLSKELKLLKELQADRPTRQSATVIEASPSEAERDPAHVPSVAKLDDDASLSDAGS